MRQPIIGGMGLGTASEVALALKSGKFVVLLKGNLESHQFFRQFGSSQLQFADQVESAIAIVRQQ